jgi:hypothetical protein
LATRRGVRGSELDRRSPWAHLLKMVGGVEMYQRQIASPSDRVVNFIQPG